MDILPLWSQPDLALPYSVCQEVDVLVCWSILFEIDRILFKIDSFLKDDRFSLGNVNMAKIYERLLSKNILGE